MGKGGGRPKDDEAWDHVTKLEGGNDVRCKHCDFKFAAPSATRIVAHINKVKGKGIRPCKKSPQSNSFGSRKANSNNDLEDNQASANRIEAHINKEKGKGIRTCDKSPQSNDFGSHKANSNNDLEDNNGLENHTQGQAQDDAKDQERIQAAGSISVSDWENKDLQVIRYVSESLSSGDIVYKSQRFHLTQQEFDTLIKPETCLVSSVIDAFVEILTDAERKKPTPSNWYLPVMFSTAAVKRDLHDFKDFVNKHKMRENYMSAPKSPEKVFIPVHFGGQSSGHFYLHIINLKNEEIEIWDSLPGYVPEQQRIKTTKTLLFAMEEIFKKDGTFTGIKTEMPDNIRSQPNEFDCGIFVMKFMEQSEYYVKIDHTFKFDSEKEREDLALKLLKSDLNTERKNLYNKAMGHHAQVEKQDGNKRLRVDSDETVRCIPGSKKVEMIGAEFHDDTGFNTCVSITAEYDVNGYCITLRDGRVGSSSGVKRINFEGMDWGNKNAQLPKDMNELFIFNCRQGKTGDRCLCRVLSYAAHNNNNGAHQIKRLEIDACHDVEYLFCLRGDCRFCCSSQLVGSLSLSWMHNLKGLVLPADAGSLHESTLFSDLKDLRVRACQNMKTLMKPDLLACLKNLRTVSVGGCWGMDKVVAGDHFEMQPPPITLPNLISLKLDNLLQLRSVYDGVMHCPSLPTVSVDYCGHFQMISSGSELRSNNGSLKWFSMHNSLYLNSII